MDERDWHIVKTIAEEKTITRAAERLYISQPAITYRLKTLEEELRTKLFFRTPKGVILTPQGEFLLSYAEEMIIKLAQTKEKLASIGDKVHGPLRIGSSSIFANNKLPTLLRGFLEHYPDVEVFLKTGRSQEVSKMLEKEEVSVAVIRGDYPWMEHKHLLFEEPICLVSQEPLEIAELPNKPRIIYGTDFSLQNMIDSWWRETFFRSSFVSMVVDNMDAGRRMVLHGLGWTILPQICLNEKDRLYTQKLYWKSGEPVVRRTWVFCNYYALELPAAGAFVSFLKESCNG